MSNNIFRKFFVSFFTVLLIAAGQSYAGTYYVSPTGAAAWASCSGTTPLNGTAACSVATAMTNAVAGDIVYFRAGNYTPSCVSDSTYPAWYPRNNGISGNPITLIAYPNEIPNMYQPISGCTNSAAVIGAGNNSYIVWDGFTIIKQRQFVAGGTLRCESSDHITVRNNTFIGNEALDNQNQVGLYNTSCDYLDVNNNIFRDFAYTSSNGQQNSGAMWLLGGINAVVRNNTFLNSANGIQTKGSANGITAYYNFFNNVRKPIHWNQQETGISNFIIKYNVAANIPSTGQFVAAFDPSVAFGNNQIFNNTVHYSGCASLCYGVNQGNSYMLDALVYNNIFYNPSGSIVFLRYDNDQSNPSLNNSTDPDFSDYNNFFSSGTSSWRRATSQGATSSDTSYSSLASWSGGTSYDTHSLTSNPLFVNTGGNSPEDYRLQTNSPIINAGIDRQDFDNDGNTTESIDMGAYPKKYGDVIGYRPPQTPKPPALQSIPQQ